MRDVTHKFGVLVCVDASAASDAAVAWGAREAMMRKLPITLMHAVDLDRSPAPGREVDL